MRSFCSKNFLPEFLNIHLWTLPLVLNEGRATFQVAGEVLPAILIIETPDYRKRPGDFT